MGGIDNATNNEYYRCQAIYFDNRGNEKFQKAFLEYGQKYNIGEIKTWPTGSEELYLLFQNANSRNMWRDTVLMVIDVIKVAEKAL